MTVEHEPIATRIAEHFRWIGKDEVRAARIYADDAVLEYIQSGERIRGTANIIASRQAYPGRPAWFEVRRIDATVPMDLCVCHHPSVGPRRRVR